jgi:hypothetical protein
MSRSSRPGRWCVGASIRVLSGRLRVSRMAVFLAMCLAAVTLSVITVEPPVAAALRGTPPVRTDVVTFGDEQSQVTAAATDGEFGYFGLSNGTPGFRIIKVQLSDMRQVGELEFPSSFGGFSVAFRSGDYGYFGGGNRITKIRLSDLSLVGVTVTDRAVEAIQAAATDGEFGYFASATWPARVVKYRLADMSPAGSVAFNAGEDIAASAVVVGGFGYFGLRSTIGRVVKIRLSDMTRVGVATLDEGEELLASAFSDGEFGYFGTDTSPGRVVKIRLSTMARVDTLTLGPGEDGLRSAVSDGAFGYFGTYDMPGLVVKVRLSDMSRVGSVTLPSGENLLLSAVTDGQFGYFGTTSNPLIDGHPGQVVKIQLDPPLELGRPTGVSTTPRSGRVIVSWSPPADDGGSPITGYLVRATPGGESCRTQGATLCMVSNLANGEIYTFTVVAENVNGSSAPSDPVVATPEPVPDAPTGVGAEPANGAVSVSWSAPAGATEFPVESYVVVADPGGQSCSSAERDGDPPSTSCRVTGLENGVQYSFVVVARNAVGESDPSAPAPATPRTVPDAPTLLGLTPGDGQVRVRWAPPVSQGGSDIIEYRVSYSADGGASWQQSASSDGSARDTFVTGLLNGVEHLFRVQAVNVAGGGAVSIESTPAVPVPPMPGRPGAPLATALRGAIRVAVTPPTSGGMPVSYSVTASPGGRTCVVVGSVGSCVIEELSENGSYRVSAVAVNAAGVSSPSPVSLLVTPGAGASTPQFADVPVGAVYVEATSMLKARQIANGIAQTNNFNPGGAVTRAEMAAFLYRMAGQPDVTSCTFKDQSLIPTFARSAACWLREQRITENDPFNPNGLLTRAQMAAFLYRLAGQPASSVCTFRDRYQIPTFARPGACWLKATGITIVDPFNPAGLVTRSQMALFLYRAGGTLGLWLGPN